MPKVFILNKDERDYSDAERFGEVLFVTKGRIPNPYDITGLHKIIEQMMNMVKEDDYIVISTIPILHMIASSFIAAKYGKVNYLTFGYGKYQEQTVIYK